MPVTPPAGHPSSLSSPTARACPTPQDNVQRPLSSGLATKLQGILEQRVAAHPGEASVSAAIVVPGKGTWAGATGVAVTDTREAASTQTAYAVASVTKTFVAALTLLLAKDGAIELDKPAARWLDASAGQKANGATIRQLLSHRSGIANFTENHMVLVPGRTWTPTQLLELAGPPRAAPGEKAEYSNTDYILLGLIAERAGGKPLEVQLRERLFVPNGLTRTFLSGRERVPGPIAHGYGTATQLTGDLYDGSGHLPNLALATGGWAAGGLASTPTDLARWLSQLCSGAVVGSELTRAMFDFGAGDYGLGIERGTFPGGKDARGHVGAIPGYVTLAFHIADSGNVIVVSTNADAEDLYLVLVDLDKAAKAT